ncbi:MAG: DegT/DnrJ/EryC1/StrS family aminotransferase, partial [bacterium]
GDEVILPSYTCQSLLHPIHHVGAEPRLADVDPETYSLSPETVEPELCDDTALIILVHTFGYPVDEKRLFNYEVPVLEDLAQSIGARLPDGHHAGRRGKACMGSLYATKQLSSGYGGFLGTDDRQLQETIRDLKSYDERSDYRPAFNYSLSDLQASLARSQLRKLDEHQEIRRKIADYYDSRLGPSDKIELPVQPQGHALYRYVVGCSNPDDVIAAMREEGIEVKRPVYEPLHRTLGTAKLTTTETLHDSRILLPLHPEMTTSKAEAVTDVLLSIVE